jgi:YcxB-like protein
MAKVYKMHMPAWQSACATHYLCFLFNMLNSTISFKYNRKQVIQALRYHFISKKEIRILMILINVFALFAAAVFAWGKITPVALLLSSFLWFTLMLSFWFILPLSVYNRAKTFKDSFTLTFMDAYMHIQNPKGSKDWSYQAFKYFIETPNFFHLYIDDRSFFLIPKEAFEDSDATHAARLMFRDKIGNK